MRPDLGFVLGYGHKDLRDAVPDIVPDYVPYKQHGQQHADTRIYQIQEVVVESVEPRCQEMMDMLYGEFQHHGCKSAEDTDQKRKDKQKVML